MNKPRQTGGFLESLRTTTLIVLIAGAISSITLMLIAGRSNPSQLVRVLFIGWDLAPFAILILATVVSTTWLKMTRTVLYVVSLAMAVSTVVSYAYQVARPPVRTAAFMFVMMPVASCALMIVTSLAILLYRRLH